MIISRLFRRGIWPLMFLWCAWPAVVQPQSASAGFKIAKDIFDGGGNPSRSTNFKLNESMGFPLQTGPIASATFKLQGGFYSVEKLQPAFASVSGRVVDYQGQQPVIGAKIMITGATSTETATDSSGRFTLKTLAVGTPYVLQPKHPGLFFQPPSREYSPLNNDQLNQDFIGSLYGDVSGNDEVRAFDASVALRYVVRLLNWQNPVRDSIAADVSGDGSIKSFDASLILRYAAGLITKFPVEGAAAPKLVAGEPAVLRMEAQPPSVKNRVSVDIFIETSAPIYSGDFKLSFNSSLLKLADISTGQIADGFLVAHAERQNEIRLALAGAHAVQRNGELFHLEWEVFGEVDSDADMPSITITEAFLNEGSSPLQILNEPFARAASPKSFYLRQNYPNPFSAKERGTFGNPATMIQYQIPAHGNQQNDANSGKQNNQNFQVRLQVYNLLGEKMRTLVNEFQQPGNYHALWDGADDRGLRVASGVYLYRFEAGDFVQVKKMLFLP